MLASQLQRVGAPFRPARQAPVAQVRRAVIVRASAEPIAAPAAEPSTASSSGAPKQGVARLSFQRGSVFKVRRVLDTMRGKSYEDALILMEYMPYRACERIMKALLSAGANAKHNQGALKSKLVVSECYADQGPYLERMQPRAKGRGCKIMKPTFHLTVKVEERL